VAEEQEEVAALPVVEVETPVRSSRKRSIILKRSVRQRPSPSNAKRRASARLDHGPVPEKEEEERVEDEVEVEAELRGKEKEEEEEGEEEEEKAEENKRETGKEVDEGSEENGEQAEDSSQFEGLTFQKAQEKLVDDLLHYTRPEYAATPLTPFHDRLITDEKILQIRQRLLRAFSQPSASGVEGLLQNDLGADLGQEAPKDCQGDPWATGTDRHQRVQDVGSI
jgi:Mg-chelatase subunit ChlI